MDIDHDELLKYAEETEAKYITAHRELGSWRAVARKYHKNPTVILDARDRVIARRELSLEAQPQTVISTSAVKPRSHLIIPDTQIKPGVPTDHLRWIGQYIVDRKPDVIIQIGDFADMPSLSSYDKGKRQAENRRVVKDLESADQAMDKLTRPLRNESDYNPEMHLTLGNHEHRIQKAIDEQANIEGLVDLTYLNFEHYGWSVYKFLDVVEVDGVHYSHYFYNPKTGKPYGGESIDTRLKTIGYSFTMGHQQGYKSGLRELGNGDTIRGLIAGSCYLHDEEYIGPQGNGHWRGIIYKHEVANGNYDMMEVSLNYLCKRYEGVHIWEFMERKYPELFAESLWLKRLKARFT